MLWIGEPVGAVGDIGPAARGRDPPGDRLDIARDIVEPDELGGEPVGGDMAMAFGKVAEQPRHEAGMGLHPQLAEIGHAARRPEPRDHCRAGGARTHPILARQPLEHGQIDRLGGGPQHRR